MHPIVALKFQLIERQSLFISFSLKRTSDAKLSYSFCLHLLLDYIIIPLNNIIQFTVILCQKHLNSALLYKYIYIFFFLYTSEYTSVCRCSLVYSIFIVNMNFLVNVPVELLLGANLHYKASQSSPARYDTILYYNSIHMLYIYIYIYIICITYICSLIYIYKDIFCVQT